MPIKFAVKIVPLYDHCQSDDLDLQGHKCVSNFDYFFNLQYLGQYLSYYIQTGHGGRLIHGIIKYMHILASMTLTLMKVTADRQRQTIGVELFRQVSNQIALNLLKP